MNYEPLGKALEIGNDIMKERHLGKVLQGEEELNVRDAKYVVNHVDQWGDGDGDVDLDDVADIAGDVMEGVGGFIGGLLEGLFGS